MKFKYDSESDILILMISEDPPVDAIEESGGIIISYSENGKPVSIEFRNASLKDLIKEGEVNISFKAVGA